MRTEVDQLEPRAQLPTADEEETINRVLSTQARSRSPSELWMTAVGGAMNSLLLWSQFPRLHWLASGFTAVAAYGAWGLLDRVMNRPRFEKSYSREELRFLKGACILIGVVGWVAALFAVASFITALEGGLSMPGR